MKRKESYAPRRLRKSNLKPPLLHFDNIIGLQLEAPLAILSGIPEVEHRARAVTGDAHFLEIGELSKPTGHGNRRHQVQASIQRESNRARLCDLPQRVTVVLA